VPAMLVGVMKGVQKLAIEPTGSSEFAFQVRKLTLHGGDCDWLVAHKRERAEGALMPRSPWGRGTEAGRCARGLKGAPSRGPDRAKGCGTMGLPALGLAGTGHRDLFFKVQCRHREGRVSLRAARWPVSPTAVVWERWLWYSLGALFLPPSEDGLWRRVRCIACCWDAVHGVHLLIWVRPGAQSAPRPLCRIVCLRKAVCRLQAWPARRWAGRGLGRSLWVRA
jgi:hypothetical protein